MRQEIPESMLAVCAEVESAPIANHMGAAPNIYRGAPAARFPFSFFFMRRHTSKGNPAACRHS